MKNIFKEKEFDKNLVVAYYSTTATDGKTYQVEHFNHDAILSVGYRVNSKRGTQFRILVFVLLSKRFNNVKATIYTKSISPQLRLDLVKHNSQYPEIKVEILAEAHDRFLLLDEKELYHIGASLKDLGKKWFAFSKMNSMAEDI